MNKLLVTLLALCLPINSRADEIQAGSAIALARQHFSDGRIALSQERFPEAIAAFRAANQLAVSPGVHFYLAEALHKAGLAAESAQALRTCLRLDNRLLTEDREEIERAISALEGEGWGESIAALHAAASYRTPEFEAPVPSVPPPTKPPEPRYLVGLRGQPLANSQVRTGAALIGVGIAQTLGGIGTLAALGSPCTGELCHFGNIIGGGVVLGWGLLHFIPGGILVSKGLENRRRAVEHGDFVLLTRSDLDAQTRRARRMALGGGISAGVSAALALAGTGMIVDSLRVRAHFEGDRIVFDGPPSGQQVAGWTFIGIGVAAFLPSITVLLAGLVRWRRLRTVTPWATAGSAGLSAAGTF